MEHEVLKTEPMEVAPRQPTIGEIILQALDKNLPVEALKGLYELHEREAARIASMAYAEALAAFQKECPTVPKTENVEVKKGGVVQYSYHFAPFDVVVKTIRDALHNHGLAFSFAPNVKEGVLEQVCTLRHRGGHVERASFPVPIATDAGMSAQQKVGSASTFAKRYALLDVLGISTGDQDTDGADGPDRGEPLELASPDQVENLQTRIIDERHNPDKLMAYVKKTMGVERLQDLRAQDLPAVHACLDATLRAREGRQG